jgi:hypothetical protein
MTKEIETKADATASPPPKPMRPAQAIQADMRRERERFDELHKRVEAENAKRQRQAQRIDRAKEFHKVNFPGEPFDPEAFNPPLTPYEIDPELQADFHSQHYRVAELEAELAAHYRARSKGGER